ncbi:MAG: uridine kinase [Elusimicrobia bacterium CG11_big_fil_rev_8_21_14_0_20_64_6]|nr:MAG: uridine kinase [Elusimicrobia bacterium CG11_big_fil_rev_8_21_14_0_20_64_6]
MAQNSPSQPPIIVGVAGGSGSGKSRLAKAIAAAFPDQTVVVCHDWYYRHNGHLDEAASLKLNFDHPRSLETALMCRHLDQLVAGKAIDAPIYDYATHSRLKETRRIEPRPLIILDGILVLREKSLRDRMAVSVYIETPDDIRLMRRVRRDCTERRVDLNETLRLYEEFVRPMHKRFVEPSSHHATWIWSQLDDKRFPDLLISDLKRRLGEKITA